MNRLVTVSNRVELPRSAAAPGGLAIGVLAAVQARGGLWFGWSGETTDGTVAPAMVIESRGVEYATIELRRDDVAGHYGGFCNGTLWPLFHYFLGAMRYSITERQAYERVNRLFAERLAPLLRENDLLWIHDYHLVSVGRHLRELGVSQRLGMFIHIPFPHIEALRALPNWEWIVRDLLAYDLVGFQTARDLASFRSAVHQLPGPAALQTNSAVHCGGRTAGVGVFPIGIDVDAVAGDARRSQASDTVRRMQAGLLQRRCVIGVDRLDYGKGLVDRLRSYERLMERHPEWLDRVTFLQIAPLSRADPRAYAEIRGSLEQTAGRINGRFAETDWTPIRYLNRNFSHGVLMGFLRNASVGVVTPVRDGMNLVAKEYVAAQDPEDPGVLVLSTLAGAAEEMTDALLVNPRDCDAVADAVHRALAMPLAERRSRHSRMLAALRRNDIHAWHRGFVERLQALGIEWATADRRHCCAEA